MLARTIVTHHIGVFPTNPEYLTIITGAVLLVFVLLQRVLTRRKAN